MTTEPKTQRAYAPKTWLELPDPETQDSWLFDVDFLLSRWGCIFGSGCKGIHAVEDKPVQRSFGCCTFGAALGPEERWKIEQSAAQLTPEEWQNYDHYQTTVGSATIPGGTRKTHSGCIFINRDDHEHPGCALHVHALNIGEDPDDWKPEACWILPIKMYWDDERDCNVITVSDQVDWFGDQNFLEWYCEDDPAAYQNETPLYVRLEAPLRRCCGNNVYDLLCAELKDRGWDKPHDHTVPKQIPVELRIHKHDLPMQHTQEA